MSNMVPRVISAPRRRARKTYKLKKRLEHPKTVRFGNTQFTVRYKRAGLRNLRRSKLIKKMTNVLKMYFLFEFLYSLCFCGNIAKDKFTIDKFLTLKKLDFFTKNPRKQKTKKTILV